MNLLNYLSSLRTDMRKPEVLSILSTGEVEVEKALVRGQSVTLKKKTRTKTPKLGIYLSHGALASVDKSLDLTFSTTKEKKREKLQLFDV